MTAALVIERVREMLAEYDAGLPYTDLGEPGAPCWSDAWQSYRLGQATELLRAIVREHDISWGVR